MTPFMLMPTIFKTVIGSWLLLLLWCTGTLFILSISDKRRINRAIKLVLFASSFVFLFICFQCVTSSIHRNISVTWVLNILNSFDALPHIISILICILFTVIGVDVFVYVTRWNRTHITTASIKEALDSLPSGVAYYRPDGMVVLKNKTIDTISYALTGKMLINGNEFENFLRNASSGYNYRFTDAEKKIICQTKDLGTWAFGINRLNEEGNDYKMIIASNITEEYKITEKLSEEEHAVEELNKRLWEYNKNLVSIMSSKEILNAKIKIHDELGLSLIAAKHYILKGGSDETKEKIKANIERNLDFLHSESIPEVTDEYELMLNTAKDLGVNIIITGTLPEFEPAKHIVATAIHECLTNTLKHSSGNEITIDVIESKTDYNITFSNNGEKPDTEITASGGLLSLKTMTEEAGGSLNIMSNPTLLLLLTLSKGDES